jgi:hypothetical protein
MRPNLFLVLFVFIFVNSIWSQQKKWPYSEFSYAKAYMYNLENNLSGSYAIIQDTKINNTVTSDGIKLSSNKIEKIVSLINSDIKGLNEGLSKTFIPHHAIVFFNQNDIPIASVMFSFDGEALRLQPEKVTDKVFKELTDSEIKNQLDKLSQFRKIIEDMGFQILNSPFEYQKLAKVKVRSLGMPKFKLKDQNSVKQLITSDDNRFDLSGFVKYNEKVLAIADKSWNTNIYRIDTSLNNFQISSFLQLCTNVELDLEGIEYANSKFYLIEEMQSEVYIVEPGKCEMVKLEIPWQSYGIDRSNWGNKGFEGIAIDSANQILYLAKEREERNIFRIDLKTMEMTEPFAKQLKTGSGHDISDMKYENGNMYILERGLGQITRFNCRTGEKFSFSFQELEYKDGQRMFSNDNPEYGMAEALLLTPDEIWIGYDNNGDPVSDYGKSLGLAEGNKTAIIIFKRPKGF